MDYSQLLFRVRLSNRQNKEGGGDQLSFEPAKTTHHLGISWHKEQAIFSKLIFYCQEKDYHRANKTAFESNSNSESQSAFHLSEDPYIAVRQYTSRGKSA